MRFLLLTAFLLLIPLAVRAEVVIVVHPSNPITQISEQDIRAIYLFKKVTWKNGLRIVPIHLGAKDPLREALSQKWLERSLGEIENFYLMRALSGQGQPPVIFASSQEVKAFVRNTQGGIAYIDRKDLDDSVKVILIGGSDSGR